MDDTRQTTPPEIVILGAGFGGLYLTLALVKQLRRARVAARVTLIDRHNYFLFSPLLHEVAVEMVGMHHVVQPVRQCLRGLPVTFHETAVERVDLDARRVHTGLGAISYDALVLALGSVTNYFGNPHFTRFSFGLKSLGDALRLRNHIISVFEAAVETRDPAARRALLTFVQAGAGFTGLETVTELRDWVHDILLHDYPTIQPEEVRFLLVDALAGLQVPSHPALARHVLRVMERKGITVRFNTPVRDAGPGWVELCDGEQIPCHTLIWTAGVQASPVVAALPVEKGSMQRVRVLPTLQVPAHPDVFALGDCACSEEAGCSPLQPTAQVANQQSPVLARNLVRHLTGAPLEPFRYRRLGELTSLGTRNAVAELGPLRFAGFPAWGVWRGVYLYKMPWWGERFRIAADWALDLFFPRDTSRVEVSPCPACTLRPDAQCPRKTHRDEHQDERHEERT